jgi:hypothetical protein
MPDMTTPLKKSKHNFGGKELEVTVLRDRPLLEFISVDKFHTARHARSENAGTVAIGTASLKYRIFDTRVYEFYEHTLRTGGFCSGTSGEDNKNLSLIFKFILQRDGLHIATWNTKELIRELNEKRPSANLATPQ